MSTPQIHVDLDRLLLTRDGSLSGTLWLTRGEEAFPYEGAPALLGDTLASWCLELQRLLTGPGQQTEVQSLDGPYKVQIRREAGDVLTLVGQETGAEAIRWEDVELVTLAHRVAKVTGRVIYLCREQDLRTPDLAFLERARADLGKALRERQ